MSLFCILKINEESSRIRIRIHKSEERIWESGSAPKFHGSPTLAAGDLDGGEWGGDAALLCVALRHKEGSIPLTNNPNPDPGGQKHVAPVAPDPDSDPDPQQLVAGDLDGGERERDAALLCVALRHRGEGDAGSRHTRRRQEQVSALWALKGQKR